MKTNAKRPLMSPTEMSSRNRTDNNNNDNNDNNNNNNNNNNRSRAQLQQLLIRGAFLVATLSAFLMIASQFLKESQKSDNHQGVEEPKLNNNNNNNNINIINNTVIVKGEWGDAIRRPPKVTRISYIPSTLKEFKKSNNNNNNEILSALSFLLPPDQRRDLLRERINTILNFGTRVAGSFSSGHQKMINLFYSESQWQPPRENIFNNNSSPIIKSAINQLPDSHWILEWDNFTELTPLGNRQFFNVIFNFNGGNIFQKTTGGLLNISAKGKSRRTPQRTSFAADDSSSSSSSSSCKTISSEKLNHIVLAAHWDSKYFKDFEFLGACDSVVPFVYLLETMRIISVLSDTVTLLENIGNDNICTRMRESLSPTYIELLKYYYADDTETIECLNGNLNKESQSTKEKELNASSFLYKKSGGAWIQLLRRVAHLPAISIILFDGEEAFVSWGGNDNTYGSRHLSQQWKNMRSTLARNDCVISRFDSIDLFVLYDLMGTAGTQFHNYFPNQSGKAFARLAEIEQGLRTRADQFSRIQQEEKKEKENLYKQKKKINNNNKNKKKELLCGKGIPELWCRYGIPHEMYTLYGLPRTHGILQNRKDIAELWVPPSLSQRNNNNNNIFFPLSEKYAQGSLLRPGFIIQDDQIHWMETQRVLHIIPVPFPPSWHKVNDNGSEIDSETTLDLFRVLLNFTLHLGDGWIN